MWLHALRIDVTAYTLSWVKTFQKLIKYLNLQTAVPIVDPAMYIKRFAAKLDLGSKTNAVCMTALKVSAVGTNGRPGVRGLDFFLPPRVGLSLTRV